MNEGLGLKTKMLVVVGLLFFIGAGYYSEYYQQDVKKHPHMYCYDTFYGSVNSALIVKSQSDGESLIAYYREVQRGKNPPINFPLLGLPTNVPVYVMGYEGPDSSLVDIVNYWDGGGKSRSYYLRGYVYRGTLHQEPPQRKK